MAAVYYRLRDDDSQAFMAKVPFGAGGRRRRVGGEVMDRQDNSRDHPGVVVRVGETATVIDAAIAPLIREMWVAGIRTVMSCQETDPGQAWIEFEEVGHLVRFLDIVTRYETGADTLFNRVAHEWSGDTSVPSWEYQLNPLEFGGCGGDDRPGRPCAFAFTVGVYIPHADLPVVQERLERYNRRMAAAAADPTVVVE